MFLCSIPRWRININFVVFSCSVGGSSLPGMSTTLGCRHIIYRGHKDSRTPSISACEGFYWSQDWSRASEWISTLLTRNIVTDILHLYSVPQIIHDSPFARAGSTLEIYLITWFNISKHKSSFLISSGFYESLSDLDLLASDLMVNSSFLSLCRLGLQITKGSHYSSFVHVQPLAPVCDVSILFLQYFAFQTIVQNTQRWSKWLTSDQTQLTPSSTSADQTHCADMVKSIMVLFCKPRDR